MKTDWRIIEIIQDHECVTQFLNALCCSMENDAVGVPNFIPMTNDPLLHEQMTKLAELINGYKKTKGYE